MARLSDRVVTGAPNGILSNDEPIQWYAADGITLIDGIKVDPTGAVYLAPAGGPTKVGGDISLPVASKYILDSDASSDSYLWASANDTVELWAGAKALTAIGANVTGHGNLDVTGDLTVSNKVQANQNEAAVNGFVSYCTNASFTGTTLQLQTIKAAAADFNLITAYTSNGGVLGFSVNGQGNVYAAGDITISKSAATNAATLFITNTGNSTGDKMDIDFTSGTQLRGRIRTEVVGSPFYGDMVLSTALGGTVVEQLRLGNQSSGASAQFAGNLDVTGSTNLGAPTNTSGRLNIENAGNAAIQIRSGGSIQMRPTANDFDWRFKQEGSSLNFYQGADLVTPVVEMKQAGVDIDGDLTVTDDVRVNGLFRYADMSEVTIAGGAVTVTQNLHYIDTEGDAATDDLNTINGGVEGMMLICRVAVGGRDVVFKNGTGNIFMGDSADVTISTTADNIMLCYYAGAWHVLSSLV